MASVKHGRKNEVLEECKVVEGADLPNEEGAMQSQLNNGSTEVVVNKAARLSASLRANLVRRKQVKRNAINNKEGGRK